MMEIPAIEKSSVDEIHAHQLKAVGRVLQYVAEKSPFYQKHFRSHSIDVRDIRSNDDFQSIPATTKDDLQVHNMDFLCTPTASIAEYTSTSGTLGRPVTIALSTADIDRLAYNEALSFACADAKEGDIYQLMLTLDRQFMAGIAYYNGIRKLGASVIRVGPGVPAMQWDAIMRLRPTALVAVPSFLAKLLEYAAEHNIDPNKTSIERAICIGESIRTADLAPGTIARRITDTWNIRLYGTYASTEMQTAFTECRHGVGGHHHPELIKVELLDENGRNVSPGAPGEVTITTLGVEAMPLVRYRTGDIAVAYTDRCACGRTTMRLGPVLGRKQYLIKLRGTTIYPNGIFDILHDAEVIADFVVEAYRGELETDELRIHAVLNNCSTEVATVRLNAIFQSRLRVVPELRFVSPAQLEQLLTGKGDRKARRFIDNR